MIDLIRLASIIYMYYSIGYGNKYNKFISIAIFLLLVYTANKK